MERFASKYMPAFYILMVGILAGWISWHTGHTVTSFLLTVIVCWVLHTIVLSYYDMRSEHESTRQLHLHSDTGWEAGIVSIGILFATTAIQTVFWIVHVWLAR